ncbi:nucleotidyltransferase family protein, partial [Bacillus sp. JJ722]|uniref:nucleotidyltransferase family protein n=1 Tax=Bacillus sp. JJ722 TaxID=3122973 RepID=UPI002FFE8BBA
MNNNNYNTDISNELKLLLEIIKENYDERELLKYYLSTDIDWGIFLRLAKHHRVYPFIYPKLSNGFQNVIPTSVIQNLNHQYKKNIFNMLLLSGEMEKISEL